MNEILSFGMVGGGIGSFVGEIHRKAASINSKAKLVAGCFSRDFDNTLSTGKNLRIDTERLYKDYREMAEKEQSRDDKIDFPDFKAGTRGVKFIDLCVKSSSNGASWISAEK